MTATIGKPIGLRRHKRRITVLTIFNSIRDEQAPPKRIERRFAEVECDLAPMKSTEDFQHCAERLRALADPDRLRIVLCLFDGEKNVGQIATALGDAVVKVSHHLGILRHARIVVPQRQGRRMNYRLHPQVVHPTNVADQTRCIEFGCCRIDLTAIEVDRTGH